MFNLRTLIIAAASRNGPKLTTIETHSSTEKDESSGA